MMRWYSLWIFLYSVGTNGFIIPDDVPTALSVFYSNAPKVKLGTDSRIGWGFRLGDRADAQILLELGPQQYTQRLANQQPFDNPNYPELSSSPDTEDDYNYETSEDENVQEEEEEEEEMSVEQKRARNETEAAVIRVEIEAMGNLISKLTNTVNDSKQTDQSESDDRQGEVTNNLIRTLEEKMNEEKAKLKDLELTSSSTITNNIQEQEAISSNNELREIIAKLKKYVDKATKTSGEALDDVAALEIETLKRVIKNLSGISKLDDGKDEELQSNEGDPKDTTPKDGTTTVKEQIQSNKSDKQEYSTEETTEHSNKGNEELQVITKFINVTQNNNNATVENDFQQLNKENDEILKFETSESNDSKITEDIEQNKELRNIDDEKEKNQLSHNLSENMEKSPTDSRTRTSQEKINESVSVITNLQPNDQINDTLQDSDSKDLNKTPIKFTKINEERETLKNETLEDFKKKEDYSEKQCNSSKTQAKDNLEDIQLKQALEQLKIKLNKQLENLNLNSTIEKRQFMNNLKILKILQEENNKRHEKHINKSQNSIILGGSYKGVSLKAYQTLSALWVKQDSNISGTICDANDETKLTEQIINNINGTIDEDRVKNIAEPFRKNAVNFEKTYIKSAENITKETSETRSGMANRIVTYKGQNETAKYESVDVQNEKKLEEIYKRPNEKKKIENTIRKVELVDKNDRGNETSTMSMKNSTGLKKIIKESETKTTKIEAPETKSSSSMGRNEVVQKNNDWKGKTKALREAENKLSEGLVETKLIINNSQKPSLIDQKIKITKTQNFKVEQDYKSGKTKMMKMKKEESKYSDSISTDRIVDEEYKNTMVTMMKAQIPRKNQIIGNNRNTPQTHQGLQSSIKMTNVPTTSSRKIKTNLVKNNSTNDLISTGSKMMALFSKMLQDAKKMNERKNMMKKGRIIGLI